MDGNVVFLFGSGISIPAGFPRTKDITDRVLNGNNVIRHTDQTYYIIEDDIPTNGLPQGYVESVKEFIKCVQLHIDTYYKDLPNHQTNYEDLYYVISQVRDSELREYDNPAVLPFIEQLTNKIPHILGRNRGLSGGKWNLAELAIESGNYIRDIAQSLLSISPARFDYLGFIAEAAKSVDTTHMFTLNHDTLLEEYFSESDLSFVDGFGEPINKVRYWHIDNLRTTSNLFLYKLHGSINWYRLRPDDGNWYDEKIGIPCDKDPWHTESPYGNLQLPLDGRPIFLAGTFNKILEYTNEIFIDLHSQFVHTLRSTNRVIVCGYGFGDKAINSQLIRWAYSDKNNKLIVIHGNTNKMIGYARNAVSRNWDEWVKMGIVSIIPVYAQDISWETIMGHL